MATEPLIQWTAPTHLYVEKKSDWYWTVGIITLALAVVAFMFDQVITAIFIIVAATTLVLHSSKEPQRIEYEINDRGIMAGTVLYPFLALESFWIPHDELPHKIILKSRKFFMPYIVIYINDIDPESVREILLTYISETEHHEPFLKKLLERAGF
jgi:hypothetical protein